MLISDFEKAYPGIKVTLTSAPTNTDTNRATLATDISGGVGHPGRVHGRRDLARPVRRAPAGGPAVGLPAVQLLCSSSPRAWSQGATYNGKVYGSPMFEDKGFLYYRKDLLAKENLPVPTTWEQLMTDSETLQ